MRPILMSLPRRPLLPLSLGMSLAAAQLMSPYGFCLRLDATEKPYQSASAKQDPVPIWRSGGLNPKAVRQISAGSLLGLAAGVAVSAFSRTLTFFFGLILAGTQFLESRGIHVIPTDSIQRYVRGINLQSLVRNNVPFKMTFGLTFMLAAFAKF